MKEAIQKAIEGGWSKSIAYTYHQYIWPEIVIDPLFWQSLGRALGWEVYKEPELTHFRDDDNFCHYHHEIKGRMWHYQWTRFIDHLAEGKSPDDFFQELLK